jgi:alpha-L-fucosidase
MYGEGPTQAASGSFSDKEKTRFTAADFRFTTKGKTLYAIALAWPESGRLEIRSLGLNSGRVKRVRLLGGSGRLTWRQTPANLTVEFPATKPCDFAFTLAITGDGLVK